MIYVTRRETFSASHRLYNPSLTEDENRRIYGKCANPNGHGHNYILEVTVAGEPDPRTGYVLDLGILKELIRSRIIGPLDHMNLNMDVEMFRGVVPTTENVAVAVWKALEGHIPAGRLYKVRLQETENNVVEYMGG